MVLAYDIFIAARNVAAILGIMASIVVSVGIIHTKAIGPWVAKPIAKAIRHELTDAVEAIILSDLIQHLLTEQIEEVVTHEMQQVLRVLAEHDARLKRIENNTSFVRDRMAERPPRDT